MSQLHYTQLSPKERCFIEISLKKHRGIREIARDLDRSPSTISREIIRNGKPNKNQTCRVNKSSLCELDARHFRGSIMSSRIMEARESYQKRRQWFEKLKARYDANKAGHEANKRKRMAGLLANPLKLTSLAYQETLDFIKEALDLRWSPEQISLRIEYLNSLAKLNQQEEPYLCISTVSIYRYIYYLKDKHLISCLRRRGKPYRHDNTKAIYNQTNRDKHSIHDRPAIIDEKGRIRDLEGDTVVGLDKKDRLLTHSDRKSGLASISKIIGFNANKVAVQADKDIERVFGKALSITYDNGVEFSAWREIEKRTKATVYFADPYSPGQRGSNENLNGLIRDFFPKGTDFKTLTDDDIMRVEFLLNNRPRKRLGGMTPYEAYVALRAKM